MATPFADPQMPSSGDGKPADLDGHVVVCQFIEYLPNISTSHGDTSCVVLDVHDITAGESHHSVRWFPKLLVSSGKAVIDRAEATGDPVPLVLGRIGRGTPSAGKSAPWLLNPVTDAADIKSAQEYMAALAAPPSKSAAKSKAAPAADDSSFPF